MKYRLIIFFYHIQKYVNNLWGTHEKNNVKFVKIHWTELTIF